jgi:hypothetical protein
VTQDTWQWAAIVGLGVLAVGLALLLVALLRSYADLVRVLHDAGIRVGDDSNGSGAVPVRSATNEVAPIEGFTGQDLEGATRAITLTGGSGPLLLAFLSSGCGTCMGFWRELRSGDHLITGVDAPVVTVTKGPTREEPGKLAELAGGAQVVMSDEAWDAFDVPMTPHFVLLDRGDGLILGEGSAPDPAGLAGLLARAVADARTISRRDFLGGGRS